MSYCDAAVRRRSERPGARWTWKSRCTVDLEIRLASAAWRTLQCVPAGGLVFSVRRNSAATFSSDSKRGRPRTKLVIQALDTALDEPLPPLAHGGLGPVQLPGDFGVRPTFRRPQHQAGTRYQRMRKSARSGKSAQLLLLLRCHFQSGFGASQRHTQAYRPRPTYCKLFPGQHTSGLSRSKHY